MLKSGATNNETFFAVSLTYLTNVDVLKTFKTRELCPKFVIRFAIILCDIWGINWTYKFNLYKLHELTHHSKIADLSKTVVGVMLTNLSRNWYWSEHDVHEDKIGRGLFFNKYVFSIYTEKKNMPFSPRMNNSLSESRY